MQTVGCAAGIGEVLLVSPVARACNGAKWWDRETR